MTVTVMQALGWARDQGLERLDAQILLAQVLGRTRAWLVAHDRDTLAAADRATFEALARRRAVGEPLAYLLGEKEFHGLSLRVTPDVLIPRPETEHLVDWALACLAQQPAPRVLDLGTGSGAIALAIRHARPDADVIAADASPRALAVARDNAARLALEVRFVDSDWWAAFAGQRFDLVVSNPPYVGASDPHLTALRHEPAAALASGPDGLDAIRAIATGAADHLRPGGWLLLEHGWDQGAAVRALLQAHGFTAVRTGADLAGRDRVTGGRVAAPIRTGHGAHTAAPPTD